MELKKGRITGVKGEEEGFATGGDAEDQGHVVGAEDVGKYVTGAGYISRAIL